MTQPQLISVEEALDIILQSIPEMGSESVPLPDALGRILAEDAVASEDLPLDDNSAMDGFAMRSTDVSRASAESPGRLAIVGESAAGSPYNRAVAENQAVRIMTGGVIPDGCDCVVEVELTREADASVVITAPVEKGRNIRPAGGDAAKGSVVLERGTRLRSSHLGMLASIGKATIGVSRRPAASFISTGSELIDAGAIPEPGQVRNSSAFMIPAMLRESGADCVRSAAVRDDLHSLEGAFRASFESDLLVSTGGVSVGKYDYVLRSLVAMGVDVKLWRLNVKPGRPFAFGVAPSNMPVFCLPGNPVSSAVTFHKLVRPAIAAMMGERTDMVPICRAALEEDIVKNDTRVHYVRGILRTQGERPTVRSTGAQASNILSSMARANCFIVLPEEARTYRAGDIVDVEML